MFKAIKSLFAAKPLPTFEPTRQAASTSESIMQSSESSFKHTKRRNFSAASQGLKHASWLSSDISLNALLESQLAIIRTRSRYLARNTSTGRRFLSLVKNNIVGPSGFMLRSRCGDYLGGKWVLDDLANQTLEAHFKLWCKAKHCDITGQSSFREICQILQVGEARDGEYLVREIIGTKDTPYRYQLQLLAIDRLDINYRGTAANGNTVRMGVERDSKGKVTAYYILERNPNDSLSLGSQHHTRVDASEIIHNFVRLEPEQIRGVPWASAIMAGQKMLHMFKEAAVEAAVVGASNMGFFVPPSPGDDAYIPPSDGEGYGAEVADDEDLDGNLIQDAVGGSFRMLPPGWKTEKFDPDYPHAAFDPFVQSEKRDIASGLDVAHHNLSGDMSGVNYSSARIAEMNERDTWREGQNHTIDKFCERVALRWLELGLLANAITMPNGSPLPAAKIDKFSAGLSFVGRGWDWVDPAKEALGATLAIEQGLATRTQLVAAKGGDFEENIIELEREMQLLKKHNIILGKTDATAQLQAYLANDAAQNQDQNNQTDKASGDQNA